jgi:Mce-associated membrane protein
VIDPSPETAPMSRLTRALVIALALALVAALVGLALLWRAWDHRRDLDDAGRAAEKAARAAAVAMTSYDHSTVDRDFGWVDTAGTARFREQYAEVSAPVKELVVRMKARAEGTVVESAARVRDTDHVTVLLFVDQTLTSASDEAGRELDQPRVTMQMVRQGGRWLVDEVELRNLSTQ